MALRLLLVLPVLVAVRVTALAQQVNPADKQREFAEEQSGPDERLRSFEMPPTVVRAFREGALREEDRIGSHGQPRWTAKRLFPTTRVYVVPEGKVEFEYWTRAKVPEEGKTEVETQYELEFGLPHRFQLDLYYVTSKTGSEGELDLAEQKYELRYAFADWGELWMNPTAYFEYVSRERRGRQGRVQAAARRRARAGLALRQQPGLRARARRRRRERVRARSSTRSSR